MAVTLSCPASLLNPIPAPPPFTPRPIAPTPPPFHHANLATRPNNNPLPISILLAIVFAAASFSPLITPGIYFTFQGSPRV